MGAVKVIGLADGWLDTAEAIVAAAAVPPPAQSADLMVSAETLAGRVVVYMARERDPGLLASVTLAIPDPRMRIAFLECIGSRLIG